MTASIMRAASPSPPGPQAAHFSTGRWRDFARITLVVNPKVTLITDSVDGSQATVIFLKERQYLFLSVLPSVYIVKHREKKVFLAVLVLQI